MTESGSRTSPATSATGAATLDRLSVLVTVDGSEMDESALEVAAALMALTDATERVLEVTEGSDVAAVVLDDLERYHADFVVMSTHAPGAARRAVLGGVADRLVRESPSPVVLVPPGVNHLSGKSFSIHRVLVPLDPSSAGRRVIRRLLTLPHASRLDLVLLQVVHPERTGRYLTPPGMPEPTAEFPGDGEWVHVQAAVAEKRLERIADHIRARGINVEVRVMEARNAASAITEAVQKESVQLIAMSTRGATGLRRLVLGSVAEQVVRQAETPVLLVTARSRA